MSSKFIRKAIAVAAALAATGAQAATINLIDIGGVTGTQAEVGFSLAARYWGQMLTNNATINLEVGYAPLDPGVIAQAGSAKANQSVASWQNRVNATKSGSTIDQTAVLPTLTTGGVSGLTVGVDSTGNNDTNITANLNGSQFASRVLYQNTSLLKGLGAINPNGAGVDASITFSSALAFDFDARDGISAGTFDFLGVAIHEMGHALGFVSGVDYFDFFGQPNGPRAGFLGYDLNDTSIFSALDMFRYSAPGTLDFRTGGSKYFSLNGGQTSLFGNSFATGTFNGDGDQASHWKDAAGCQAGNGIMDPTFCRGQMGFVSALDLAAFDAMGWNLRVDALTFAGETSAQITQRFLPEPSTWALLIGALAMMAASRRSKSF